MARINIKRLAAAAALTIAAGGATAASAATTSSPFRVVPSPSPGSPRLMGSTAISATDVWAVGSDTSTREGIAEHWDGSTWTVVATPSRIQGGGALTSVSAVSSTDVWAVGSSAIEHWNGKAWSVVPDPVGGRFTSVHAISTNNVYAVTNGGEGGNPSFVEHWNGSKWSIIQTAAPGTGSNTAQPDGVSASSASDVWIVGELPPQVTNQPYIGFAEHFDGKVWRNVPFPGGAGTRAVDAVSPTNAWAVGGGNLSHWNGTTWKLVSDAQTAASGSAATAIASRSATDIWAVGVTNLANGDGQTFAEHFNGTTWSAVPTPSPRPAPNPFSTALADSLSGVSVTADGHVYTVGDIANNYANNMFTDKALILENDLG